MVESVKSRRELGILHSFSVTLSDEAIKMFEKSLAEMVKGIRAHKKDEGLYISKCIAEIREELGTRKHSKKSEALLKLIYVTPIFAMINLSQNICLSQSSCTCLATTSTGRISTLLKS